MKVFHFSIKGDHSHPAEHLWELLNDVSSVYLFLRCRLIISIHDRLKVKERGKQL